MEHNSMLPEDMEQQVPEELQFMQDVDPEYVQQVEVGQAAITEMIYSPQTKADVQKMLQTGNPTNSLPKTSMAIFEQFKMMTSDKTGPMPLDVQLALGVHTFFEVLELGGAMGVIPPTKPEESGPILQKTMQEYIQKGLKDKSIDPIELQQQVEPMMTQDERGYGMDAAGRYEVPGELSQHQQQQGMLSRRMRPMELENERLKKESANYQKALAGVAKGGNE